MFEPGYLTLFRTGELYQRAEALESLLEDCTVCLHECRINRINGETDICNVPADIIISNASPHFGEEPPLVRHNESGTIFFTYCNLQCIFCQNYTINHLASWRREAYYYRRTYGNNALSTISRMSQHRFCDTDTLCATNCPSCCNCCRTGALRSDGL